VLPIPILDTVEAVTLFRHVWLARIDTELGGSLLDEKVLQLLCPYDQIERGILVPLESQRREQALVFAVLFLTDADMADGAEARTELRSASLRVCLR
jgi:hypothetical protein